MCGLSVRNSAGASTNSAREPNQEIILFGAVPAPLVPLITGVRQQGFLFCVYFTERHACGDGGFRLVYSAWCMAV